MATTIHIRNGQPANYFAAPTLCGSQVNSAHARKTPTNRVTCKECLELNQEPLVQVLCHANCVLANAEAHRDCTCHCHDVNHPRKLND
jgi:hypothetical protein